MGRWLGYMVVPFSGGCETLGGSGRALNPKVPLLGGFSAHLRQLRGYSALTDLIKHQSIGAPQGPLHTLVCILNISLIGHFVGR